jgi:lipid-A-disaccharide synthase
LVPEFMQDDCTAENLSRATLDLLGDSDRRGAIVTAFEYLHQELRGGLDGRAADHAAEAVADLIATSGLPASAARH